jgi:IS605 OrfB family transposase
MKLTVQIQLLPDATQSAKLLATVERFNAAAGWIAGELFARQLTNKIEAQRLLYAEIRQRFGLSSQMAILCLHRACEAYKRDKEITPKFKKHAAITYDVRTMSFKGIDKVSLLTLDGRVVVPFLLGKYQAERLSYPRGQCDLVLRKDGKWFLLVTVELPEGTKPPATDFIGIDLGVVNIATDSDGGQMSAEKVEKARRKYGDRRRELQKAATEKRQAGKRPRSIRRKLVKDRAKESRYKRDVNHCESKRYVELAERTGRGIAMEDLTGIRDGVTARGKDARNRLSGWSFAQFRWFVEYKARMAGVPVLAVDPAYTSQECAECGHRDRRNRKTQAAFRCVKCGHKDHADVNAARNIRARAIVMVAQGSERVQVATSQTAR